MNLIECYNALGGNYEDVLRRLTSERLVKKFAVKFLDDKSYELLETSLNENNTDEAFRAAHTIKGVCANLGFNKLLHSSEAVTEALRAGELDKAKDLFPALTEDYQLTVNSIKALDD